MTLSSIEMTQRSPDWHMAKRLWPYLRPHLWLLVAALVAMPLHVLAGLLQPLLIKKAIDAAIVDRNWLSLTRISWYFLGCIVAEFVSGFGQNYCTQLAGQCSVTDLRRGVFQHLHRLRLAYFDRNRTGVLVTRVTNDIDNLSELFSSGAVLAIADLLTLVGIIAFMLSIDWQLSLVTFAALPPLLLVVRSVRHRARLAFRVIRQRLAELNTYLSEQVQGIAVVESFGKEAQCADEYRRINDAYRDANIAAVRYDALLYSVVESVAAAALALILWYASLRLGWMSSRSAGDSAVYIGTVVAFYEYIQRFFEPIRELSQRFTVIQSSIASAERVVEVMNLTEYDAPSPANVTAFGATTSPTADNTGVEGVTAGLPSDEDAVIRFVDVGFSYTSGRQAIAGVNLRVGRGSKVAIVGATGSGKTTLTSLLLRLYEYDSGTIFVEGVDIRRLVVSDLRQKFAVVSQDVFLTSGTVFENLTLGIHPTDAKTVEHALGQVGALDLVLRRPGGLHSKVEERGSNFSGGERQLLALARALILDRQYLILDEATSSVDSETEHRLQVAIAEVLRGRTALIIAHRLSTVQDADQIVVMHKGRLVETGSHDQLLQAGGYFAKLHRLHFR